MSIDYTDRRLVIIGVDGTSDFPVIERLVNAVFEQHTLKHIPMDNVIRLPKSLRNDMDAYLQGVQTIEKNRTASNPHYLFSPPAIKLKNAIVNMLYLALKQVGEEEGIELTNRDLLIINSDSEYPLLKQDNYFKERAYTLKSIFDLAIEEFYHKNRPSYQYLPLILPLILFPSTEILVAVCKSATNFDLNFRSQKALQLKRFLYKKHNIQQVKPKDLQAVWDLVNADNLETIYQYIPEARGIIQALSFLEE